MAIVLLAAIVVPTSALSMTAADEAGSTTPPAPVFAEPGTLSTNEGHVTLSWSVPGENDPAASDLTFELQQSRGADFDAPRVRHRGPQWSLFVSGMRAGRNHFRVRAILPGSAPGPWSDPLTVDVVYPSRGRVILLLAVGCVVFAATVVAIVTGWIASRRGRGALGERAAS